MKEYKKLVKMLKQDGFEQISDGNHVKFSKHGVFIVITQNIRNAAGSYKNAIRQHNQAVRNSLLVSA